MGKADNPLKRWKRHRSPEEKCPYKSRWVSELRALGLKPELEVLEEVPYEQREEIEREYIRVFRMIGIRLTNISDGGEGVTFTPEVRDKISRAQIGRKRSPESIAKTAAGNAGKKRTPEQRARMSAGMTGVKKGPMSSENRAAISAANKGRVKSEQECENISRGKKGTVFSPAALANSLATRRKNAEQKKAGAICS